MPIEAYPKIIGEGSIAQYFCPFINGSCKNDDCMMWVIIEKTDMQGNSLEIVGGKCGLISNDLEVKNVSNY